MRNKLLLFAVSLIFFSCYLNAQPKYTEINSKVGAFSRMGFGARGIGMGNAMSAITSGNLVSYYNPAVSPFQENNSFQTGYTFLSMDRSLNFLNFTRKFDFYSAKDSSLDKKPTSTAGISAGIINSGISGIDGRDNNGLQTEELSTSENQFFLSVANRFSRKLSIGIAVKFYYYKLYEEITSSGLGLDIGALYKVNDNWNVSLVISDINSKYDWDTSPIYEQQGLTTKDNFPLLKKIGVSYYNPEYRILAALEFESSNAGTNIIRFGTEYNIYENLFIRAGIDQFNLSNSDAGLKPSFGFSYSKSFDGIMIGVDYAFMIEQYSPSDRHLIGVNFVF
jgi:opacity protein-like surface antigen